MKKTLLSSALVASVLILAGCGPSEKQQAASRPPPADPPGLKVIRLTGDDLMRFNITTIEATAGEPMRVILKNIGRMPKQTMSHNFVLLQPMSEAGFNAFGMVAAASLQTHLPKDMSAVIVHTKMLGPGESDQVDFNAPSEPGEYPFLCTFPGHFAMMRGKLIVR